MSDFDSFLSFDNTREIKKLYVNGKEVKYIRIKPSDGDWVYIDMEKSGNFTEEGFIEINNSLDLVHLIEYCLPETNKFNDILHKRIIEIEEKTSKDIIIATIIHEDSIKNQDAFSDFIYRSLAEEIEIEEKEEINIIIEEDIIYSDSIKYIDDFRNYVYISEILSKHVDELPKQIPERTWAEFITEGVNFIVYIDNLINMRVYAESFPKVVTEVDEDEPEVPIIVISPDIRMRLIIERGGVL
jgi:hypothetical protein